MNSSIHILPSHIINQIKAGEVVERPANIVKEILENALDAGADKLHLHIQESGLKQIFLQDNGHGISYSELPLAFQRHATSKINSFDDLYQLNSFGFRGEALASIASVSQITCYSETKEETSSLELDEGQISSHLKREKTNEVGTKLYVKNLFYNTPVRLKFTKSQQSEKRQIQKTFKTFLISYPQIEFSITWDEGDKTTYPKTQQEKRISDIFYKRQKSPLPLLHSQTEYGNLSLEVFISQDSSSGYSSKEQFLFVNQRFFEDRKLHAFICRKLSHLWPERTQGHYAIFLKTEPQNLDVNIHPQKTQIKFLDSSLLYSLLGETLQNINRGEGESLSPSPPFQSSHEQTSFNHEQRDLKHPINSLSLNNFSHRYESHPYEPPSHKKEEKSWQLKARLPKPFSLYFSPDEQSYLLNQEKLATWDIKRQFQLNPPRTPLLISELIKDLSLSSEDLELLHEKGFELDPLNIDEWALRTLPQFLLIFNYQDFLKEILMALTEKNWDEFPFHQVEFQSIGHLNKIIEDNFANLIQEKILLQLNSSLLKKLWT